MPRVTINMPESLEIALKGAASNLSISAFICRVLEEKLIPKGDIKPTTSGDSGFTQLIEKLREEKVMHKIDSGIEAYNLGKSWAIRGQIGYKLFLEIEANVTEFKNLDRHYNNLNFDWATSDHLSDLLDDVRRELERDFGDAEWASFFKGLNDVFQQAKIKI